MCRTYYLYYDLQFYSYYHKLYNSINFLAKLCYLVLCTIFSLFISRRAFSLLCILALTVKATVSLEAQIALTD